MENKTKEKHIYVDITPKWFNLLPFFKDIILNGSQEQRLYLITEMEKLLKIADDYGNLNKELEQEKRFSIWLYKKYGIDKEN